MQERLTLLIYNEGGSFVRLKLLSKRFLKISGVIGVFGLLIFGFILVDYGYMKYRSFQSGDLKTEVHNLQSELKSRKKQIEAFYTRIDSLQLKLIKLNQLEQEIRSFTGIHNDAGDIGDYGVGGNISDDTDKEICTAEVYNNFLENMDADVERMDQQAGDQSEGFQALWSTLREIKAIQQVTPTMQPLEGGWISSGFGFRKSPFTNQREFHSGLDIAAHKGAPVRATANGTVSFAGCRGNLGKAVFVNHGFGIKTRYGHLSKLRVKEGQKVKRGDVIGEVGSTGRSTGPHLHYEVRLNDIPVNAEKYMSAYLANKDPS